MSPASTNVVKSALSGLSWSFIGTAAQSLLHLAILTTLARTLTPLDFGIVGTVLLLVTLVKTLCRLGISQAIVQRDQLGIGHVGAGFAICVALGIAGTIAISTTAYILTYFTQYPELGKVLAWFTAIPVVFGLGIVPEGLLQRNFQFKSLAQADIASYLFGYGAVGIGSALSGAGILSLALAYWAQLLIRTVMLCAFSDTKLIQPFSRNEVIDLLHHGSGQTVAAFFNYGAMEGDKLAITTTLGMGILGIYGRAYQLAVLPAATLGMVVEKVAFPAFSQLQKKHDVLRETYSRGIILLLSIFLPVITFQLLAATEVVSLILGNQWAAVTPLFKVLVLSGFFRAAYRFSEAFARANGDVYKRAWRHGVYAFMVLFCSFSGSVYGGIGIAAGVAIAIFVHYVLVTHLSLQVLRLSCQEVVRIHGTGVAAGAANSVIILVISLLLRLFDFPWIVYLGVLALVTFILTAKALYSELRAIRLDGEESSSHALAA